MKFKNDIEAQSNIILDGALTDAGGSPGTVNQLLSSTVTGTAWIDPATIVAEAATLVVIACKNTSGATIAQGTPVYQTGTVGATATIEIAPADALISENKLPAIGLLETALNNNGFGFVVISGALTKISTSPIDGVVPTTGDKVFVKSGGGLTLTKPTGEGNGIQNMGLVGKVSSGNSGSITVSSIMRTNDVPNLPEGRIWVGDGNTLVSDTVYIDEPNLRFGIGTTSPTSPLTIKSNSTSSSSSGLTIQANGNTNDIFQLGEKSTDGSRLQMLDAGVVKIALYSDGTDNYISAGNVGIGTTSPGNLLQVGAITQSANVGPSDWNQVARFTSTNRKTSIVVQASGTGSAVSTQGLPAIEFDPYAADAAGRVKTAIVAVDNYYGYRKTDLAFVLDSANDLNPWGIDDTKMIIKNSGNVGIGTTSPSLKLDIDSGTANSALRVLSTDRYTGIKFEDVSNSDTLFYDGQSDLMYLSSTNFRAVDLHATGNLRVEGAVYDSNNSPGTANQVLVSTVTGTDWVDGSGSSIIGGPYLPLAGGTMTGDLRLNDGVELELGSGQDLRMYHDGSNGYMNNFTGDLYIRTFADDKDIIFQSDDGSGGMATYMYLDGGGGLTRLSRRLRASDGVNIEAGSSGDLQIYHDGTHSYIAQAGTGNLYIQQNTADKDLVLQCDNGSGGTTAYLVLDGSTTNAYFSNPGNVGIGTTSPGAKLEVSNGSSGFTGSYNGRTASVFEGSNSAGTTISIMSPSTGYSGLFFGDENNEAEGQIQYDHSASAFKFLNGGGSERMRIASNGNVGIGTTSPSTPLQVNGIVRIDTSGNPAFYEGDGVRLFGSQNYRFRNTSGNVRAIINVTSGNFTLYNASDNVTNLIATAGDSYFNGGNVGIGTTSPNYTLDIEGEVRILNTIGSDPFTVQTPYDRVGKFISTDAGAFLCIQDSSSTNNGNGINVSGDTLTLTTASAGRVDIGSTGVVKFRNYDSTNNTGAPTYLLGTDASGNIVKTNTIPGSGAGPYLPLSAGSSYPLTGKLYAQDDIYISGEHVVKNIDTNLYLDSASGYNVLLRPGGSEKVRIQANGNVGIGTTSPGAKLDVTGEIKTSSNFIADNATLGSLSLRISGTETGRLDNFNSALRLINFHATSETAISGNADISLTSVGSSNIKLSTANTERMRIDSSGNVMIGNTNASAKLDIRQDTGYALRTENASGSTFRVEADTGNIEAAGSVKMGDDTDTASAAKVGTLKYRVSGNNSYVDMCMQTGATTYAWINIVQNNW